MTQLTVINSSLSCWLCQRRSIYGFSSRRFLCCNEGNGVSNHVSTRMLQRLQIGKVTVKQPGLLHVALPNFVYQIRLKFYLNALYSFSDMIWFFPAVKIWTGFYLTSKGNIFLLHLLCLSQLKYRLWKHPDLQFSGDCSPSAHLYASYLVLHSKHLNLLP